MDTPKDPAGELMGLMGQMIGRSDTTEAFRLFDACVLPSLVATVVWLCHRVNWDSSPKAQKMKMLRLREQLVPLLGPEHGIEIMDLVRQLLESMDKVQTKALAEALAAAGGPGAREAAPHPLPEPEVVRMEPRNRRAVRLRIRGRRRGEPAVVAPGPLDGQL